MSSLPQLSLFDGKSCSSCLLWKPYTCYRQADGYRDGYVGQCTPCRNKVCAARQAQRRIENPEKAKAEYAAWYAKVGVAYFAQWRAKNPEKAREANRRRYWKDPQKSIQLTKDRIAWRDGSHGTITVQEWQALCARFNHRCLCCGGKKKLTQDHIVPISKGGANEIHNCQPLCVSCNSRKNNRHINFRPDRLLE